MLPQGNGSLFLRWFPNRKSFFNSTVIRFSLVFLLFSVVWRILEHTHFLTSLPPMRTKRFWVAAIDGVVVLIATGTVWILLAFVQYKNQHLSVFKRGIEALGTGVIFTDPNKDDNPITWVNEGFLDITGYNKNEVLGQNCRILQGDDTDEETVNEISESISNQEQISTEILNYRQDGTPFWNQLTIAPIFDETGELFRFVGIQKDVTERKEMEIELSEQKRRFEQIVNNIESVFWLSTVDKEMLYVSPTFEDIWGKPAEEIFQGDDLADFFEMIHPDDRDEIRKKIYNQQASGNYDEEYRIIRPDGDIRWVHDQVFPISDDQGEVTRLAGLAQDITDRKRLQQRLQSLLEEKETLLKEVHHRVKNNFQVILSLLGLQRRRIDNPDAREALKESKLRIHSMAKVHKKLYEGAELHKVHLEDYVTELVDHIVETNRHDCEAELSVNVDVQPVNLDVDTVINCGLLINELVTNSIKYAFREDQSGKIKVKFYTDEDLDRHLIVKDNGNGFEPDAIRETQSLGIKLIENLAENQLGGTINFSQSDWMISEITFPPQHAM